MGTLIIVIAIVFLILIITRWYDHHHKKQIYNGLAISRKEAEEIPLLQKEIRFANKYCKKLVTTLFLSVNKELPVEVKKSQPKNVLLFCENIVLRSLNYLPDLWEDETALMQTIDNKDICEKIKKDTANIVKPITGEEPESFYQFNADAWQIRYAHLINNFTRDNIPYFYAEICKLAEFNDSRTTVASRIYTKAYQFLVKVDREYSLRFYIHSICYNSPKISTRNRKILFRNKQEEQAFDKICENVHTHTDTIRTLEQFEKLNITQRKKISLNADAIKEVAKKQTRVAGVLSELLAEEEELSVTQKPEPTKQQVGVTMNTANNHEEALLKLFITNSFRVNKKELDIFVQTYGLFPSQCIEQINDAYFEELDDVLIEEEGDCYIMNQDYYKQIAQNGN